MLFVNIFISKHAPKGARGRSARANGTRNAANINQSDQNRACRWALALLIMRAETSVRRRFLSSSRASRSLPLPMHVWYRYQSTRVRRDFNLRWRSLPSSRRRDDCGRRLDNDGFRARGGVAVLVGGDVVDGNGRRGRGRGRGGQRPRHGFWKGRGGGSSIPLITWRKCDNSVAIAEGQRTFPAYTPFWLPVHAPNI